MKQTYHSNSTTNLRLRSEINKSGSTYTELSEKYGVSENTVGKWKTRTSFKNKSSRPHSIGYSLSEVEMLTTTMLASDPFAFPFQAKIFPTALLCGELFNKM